MTLRDLKDNGIKIQGKVSIKTFDNENDSLVIRHYCDDFETAKIPDAIYDLEIDYMYCAFNVLHIELKEDD